MKLIKREKLGGRYINIERAGDRKEEREKKRDKKREKERERKTERERERTKYSHLAGIFSGNF